MNRTTINAVPGALARSAIFGTFALCLSAVPWGQALAEAGRIEFVVGGASVRDASGQRPLVRGLELQSGDTVLTTDGRVQIRFTDGAFVSLQPNTEFAIRDYRFNGRTDGTESGVFGLVRGAMRTVTGLIGRVNRDKYKIETPTATVGIRGTGGHLSVLSNGATRLFGTSGTWFLATNAGLILVTPRTTGLATSMDQAPTLTTDGSPPGPQGPTGSTPPISREEQRNGSGGSAAVGGSKAPISLAYAEVLGGTSPISPGALEPLSSGGFTRTVLGDVSSSGVLNAWSYTESYLGNSFTFEYKFNGVPLDAGGDGGVSWARWIGPATTTTTQVNGVVTTSGVNFPANGGFHYAVGPPATQMPTAGSFMYNMVGATSPTIKDASLPPGVVTSAQLLGSFTPTGGSVSLGAAFSFNSVNYTMTQSGTISGTGFSGSGTVVGGSCLTCSAGMQGEFFNPGATHAAVSYTANTTASPPAPGPGTVAGVIVLKR